MGYLYGGVALAANTVLAFMYGASERLIVAPGHEADGLIMLPCGESGHPLSPHYGDSHRQVRCQPHGTL